MIKEAMLYEKLDNEMVHCYLCGHHCKIRPSQFGICGVRQNRDGVLNTLVYAEPIAANIDPIEKKPLYHFLPGSTSFSIATIGCNFKCGFCQNWQISQSSKKESNVSLSPLLPEEIVERALAHKCRSISYTYTEPTIFFEYAYDTAKLAKEKGLYNNFVTNGYMTKEALKTIQPYLDAANVDLKSFQEDFYIKMCKGHLQPVLDSIRHMKEIGIWVEATTLIVPHQNDSQEELTKIARFIASVSIDIPWHISRFHPDYKLTDTSATPLELLRKAQQIGTQAGLRYVYLGNVQEGSDTFCHKCQQLLIKREYFSIEENHVEKNKCAFCGVSVGGVF